jgi:hypothetical protein
MDRVSTSTLYLIPGIGLPPIDLRTWSNRRGRPSDKPLMRLGDQKENTTNFRKARTMFQASILTATHEFPCFFRNVRRKNTPLSRFYQKETRLCFFHRHNFSFCIGASHCHDSAYDFLSSSLPLVTISSSLHLHASHGVPARIIAENPADLC